VAHDAVQVVCFTYLLAYLDGGLQVESLSASRQSVSANEPLDSIRVVNALLTQLDAVKRFVVVVGVV